MSTPPSLLYPHMTLSPFENAYNLKTDSCCSCSQKPNNHVISLHTSTLSLRELSSKKAAYTVESCMPKKSPKSSKSTRSENRHDFEKDIVLTVLGFTNAHFCPISTMALGALQIGYMHELKHHCVRPRTRSSVQRSHKKPE